MQVEMYGIEECGPDGEPTGIEVATARTVDRATIKAQALADRTGRIHIVSWVLWEVTRAGRETIDSMGNVVAVSPK
jgi:hypothetical protein